jgi:hypothetical protein
MGRDNKMEERRKDIGLKLLYGMAGSLIAFLLSIIFFATYKKADAAMDGLGEVKKDVAVLQECVKTGNENYKVINYKLDKLLGWEK